MNDSNKNKLLLVDDSRDLIEILKIFFKGKDYVVEIISNCSEIYSSIKNFEPDILLMDVLLNGADGRQLCKTLRNGADTMYLGIILTSASPGNLENYMAYGADDYIEKPFELTDLEQKVTSILARRKMLSNIH
jgi:DNA-binding response OmpR family regulator